MIQSGSSYPALCKIVLSKLSCMSSSLLFQSTRYVMLHDGKSLITFVSGEIQHPTKFWDQFHLPKNFLGPIPTSQKIVWDYFHPCIPPDAED